MVATTGTLVTDVAAFVLVSHLKFYALTFAHNVTHNCSPREMMIAFNSRAFQLAKD